MQSLTELVRALESFVDCIDATGGVVIDEDGFVVPAIDDEWIDLGYAYAEACAALERDMLFEKEDVDDHD
jgi:hypothetical protein